MLWSYSVTVWETWHYLLLYLVYITVVLTIEKRDQQTLSLMIPSVAFLAIVGKKAYNFVYRKNTLTLIVISHHFQKKLRLHWNLVKMSNWTLFGHDLNTNWTLLYTICTWVEHDLDSWTLDNWTLFGHSLAFGFFLICHT